MKALSIKQPWADAIIQPSERPKRTENRGRRLPTKYVGERILLHASKLDDPHAVLCRGRDWPDRRGVILGAATFTGSHEANAKGPLCCAPWGDPDAWHWQLADVQALPTPVPAKGALGFWTPTDAVLDAVHRQIEVPW